MAILKPTLSQGAEVAGWHELRRVVTNSVSVTTTQQDTNYDLKPTMAAGTTWLGSYSRRLWRADFDTTLASVDRASDTGGIFYVHGRRQKAYYLHIIRTGGPGVELYEKTIRMDRYDLTDPTLTPTEIFTRNTNITDNGGRPAMSMNYSPVNDRIYCLATQQGGTVQVPSLPAGNHTNGYLSVLELDPSDDTFVVLHERNDAAKSEAALGIGSDASQVYFATFQRVGFVPASPANTRETVTPLGGSGQTPTLINNVAIGSNQLLNYGLYLSGIVDIKTFDDGVTFTLANAHGSKAAMLTTDPTKDGLAVGGDPPYDLVVYDRAGGTRIYQNRLLAGPATSQALIGTLVDSAFGQSIGTWQEEGVAKAAGTGDLNDEIMACGRRLNAAGSIDRWEFNAQLNTVS